MCVCPFSYVTSKVMGRNNLSLCSQQVYEETLTYSKGVLDIEENFLIVRRARHWRRLTGKGAGGCVISPGSFPGWVKVACVLYSFSLLIWRVEERVGDLVSSSQPCCPCCCDTCPDEAGFVLPSRARSPAELCSETAQCEHHPTWCCQGHYGTRLQAPF